MRRGEAFSHSRGKRRCHGSVNQGLTSAGDADAGATSPVTELHPAVKAQHADGSASGGTSYLGPCQERRQRHRSRPKEHTLLRGSYPYTFAAAGGRRWPPARQSGGHGLRARRAVPDLNTSLGRPDGVQRTWVQGERQQLAEVELGAERLRLRL